MTLVSTWSTVNIEHGLPVHLPQVERPTPSVGRYDHGVAPLVVGFDLDLTLVDSRPGIAATYRALSDRTGVYIDADAAVTRLGPPLDVELALWFPAEQVAAMGDEFRRALPGRTRSPPRRRCRVRRRRSRRSGHGGGRVVVITGKYEPNARLHLDHLGLEADEVVGWAWAEGKVDAMTDARGDASTSATIRRTWPPREPCRRPAIGVLTGGHSADELRRRRGRRRAGGSDRVSPAGWTSGHDLGWVGTARVVSLVRLRLSFGRMRSAVPTGRVKWYEKDKGFGFLTSDDGGDVFVHKAALPAGVEDLKAGQRVEFGVVDSRKGAPGPLAQAARGAAVRGRAAPPSGRGAARPHRGHDQGAGGEGHARPAPRPVPGQEDRADGRPAGARGRRSELEI